jgi:hypothetical protein
MRKGRDDGAQSEREQNEAVYAMILGIRLRRSRRCTHLDGDEHASTRYTNLSSLPMASFDCQHHHPEKISDKAIFEFGSNFLPYAVAGTLISFLRRNPT